MADDSTTMLDDAHRKAAALRDELELRHAELAAAPSLSSSAAVVQAAVAAASELAATLKHSAAAQHSTNPEERQL